MLAIGARLRWNKCHLLNTFRTHETFTPLTPQCWTAISTRTRICMNPLRSFWKESIRRFKMNTLAYDSLIRRIHIMLITATHPQQPQVLMHQRSYAQHLTPPSQAALPSSSRQMLPSQPPMNSSARFSHHDGVSQLQDVTSRGHLVSPIACSHGCPSTGSQSADRGQQGSHTTITSFPGQFVQDSDCIQGSRGSSGQRIQRRRRRSPQHRGAKEIALAVSSPPATYFCADCV
jgi:hypothetical protein